MARNRCSVETYSSLKLSASLNAPSSTSFSARPMCCWAKPCTFGKRPISRSISWDNASLGTPSRARSGGTTPSACVTKAASKWTGSICWFSWRAATSCALCTASWALTVIFSNRNMATSVLALSLERGAGTPASPIIYRSRVTLDQHYLPEADAAIAGAATLTLICFGLASSRFGMFSVSTPFW